MGGEEDTEVPPPAELRGVLSVIVLCACIVSFSVSVDRVFSIGKY